MRILIVEDEPNIATFLKTSLEAEYFAVDVAEDGERGLYLGQVNAYDVILLDNLLPKKDGRTVCRELRASGIPVPILVLSVRNETVKKVDLLDAGADDYVTKPFELDELLARIRALLRRPKELDGDVLQVGSLSLDTKRLGATIDGRSLDLTRKEFMLLEYLMRHEGDVVSRGMLLEHVWDMSIDVFSNTIESHVLSLRRKLGDTGKDRLIKTVSGRGYKIEA